MDTVAYTSCSCQNHTIQYNLCDVGVTCSRWMVWPPPSWPRTIGSASPCDECDIHTQHG